MFADLHLHTHFSDGTFSPEEVAQRASRLGIKALALTDHDSVEGCDRMEAACRSLGIEYAPGTELTAQRDGNEVHLLGYFLDTRNPLLLEELRKFQLVRQERIHKIVECINKLGVPLKVESVFAIANCQAPGRPHVGRALVQEGFCNSLDEAFERFLKKNRPAWVPKFKMSAFDAMDLIHAAGGLAVMAHPGLNSSDEFIPILMQHGLDGIECYHSKHTPSMTAHYIRMAMQNKLLITGGSDCHGNSKGKPLIGKVRLPIDCWQKLKEAALRRSQTQAKKNSPSA
jgi:predicted metal-dependent phosphoesterase TrpH